MISINQKSIDLILQVEEYTSLNIITDNLSLDINNILLICPNQFLQRFIGGYYEGIKDELLEKIELDLIGQRSGYLRIEIMFKGKLFNFHIILLKSEVKVISHPFKGDIEYNVGHRIITNEDISNRKWFTCS